jgi:hypothetical protein
MSSAALDPAAAVGAADLFVLRRVAPGRFVHLGGSGRGKGWAGIVEVAVDDEQVLAESLRSEKLVRLDHPGRELVFGPYYARGAVVVPMSADTIVVFGAADAAIEASEEDLVRAARAAADEIKPAGAAKQLADELELLEAIRMAAAIAPTPVEQAMRELAAVAAEALSCELGIVYVGRGDRVGIVERGWSLATPAAEVAKALAGVLERQAFPFCVQDAKSAPLPGTLALESGIRSYYLLELTGPAGGVLLVAHTDAAPRGFTLLCRRLGERLAEVASAVLGVGLTREWTVAEAVRLQTAFAELER